LRDLLPIRYSIRFRPKNRSHLLALNF
jgi:hypothetical protein